MNRRKFLKRSLEIIIIFSIVVFSCGKNPVNSEGLGIFYVVKTINKASIEKVIEEAQKKNYPHEFPLEIKLEDYKPEAKFKGSVKFITLGWLKIINYGDSVGNNNRFVVNTKGILGPVEFIVFHIQVLTEKNMKGTYVHAGPLIDTTPLEFKAVSK